MTRLPTRLLALFAATLLAGPLAGCLGAVSDAPGGARTAADMLANPPGSGVLPTGKTKEFTLYLHRMEHELYPGARMAMWGFSFEEDPATAQVPGPEFRVTEGDRVVITFRSLVPGFNHTIHWHGQHVPWDQDGVPYLSQEPIEPGQEFTYSFIAKPAGTYWYHCHVDAQHHIDMGMYGPFIVEPANPSARDPPFDAEFTMMLDEMDRFHLEGGQPAAGNAPQSGDPFDAAQYAQRQAQDAVGRNPQVQDRATGTPARPARDWYPVTYAPYQVTRNTFLINGMAFPYTQPILIDEGKTLRIRMINAGDEVHAMHLHGHHFLVTHKDGIPLAAPYWADTILIAPGERYDLYVRGTNPGVWDFHDHINENAANDHIFPGGMMTALVYREFADQVRHGHDHGRGHARNPGVNLHPAIDSGAYVRWYDLLG